MKIAVSADRESDVGVRSSPQPTCDLRPAADRESDVGVRSSPQPTWLIARVMLGFVPHPNLPAAADRESDVGVRSSPQPTWLAEFADLCRTLEGMSESGQTQQRRWGIDQRSGQRCAIGLQPAGVSAGREPSMIPMKNKGASGAAESGDRDEADFGQTGRKQLFSCSGSIAAPT